MNLKTPKILAMVAAAGILASLGAFLMMRRSAISPPRPAPQAGKAPYPKQQFPLPVPQALGRDLEGKVAGRQTLKDTMRLKSRLISSLTSTAN